MALNCCQIRVIPVLDSCRKFINIITHENIPIQYEKSISTRAKAPVRISFGGGGSDLTHYFWENKGAVINSTINLYSHAYLRPVSSKKITIFSADLNETLEAENIDEALVPNQNFRLIQSLLRVIDPTFGFELYLYSDFPMKSGLGGSAVVSAVILGAFNQTRRDKWTDHEISELAFQAERLYSKVAGG